MTEEPKNSADLVGHVLEATSKLARSRRRLETVLIVVLVLVIAALAFENQSQRATSHDKDLAISAQTKTISGQAKTITQLQNKSGEQTVAEVQLRGDVNKLSALNKSLTADHLIALSVYCSIAKTVHDTYPAVAANCK